MGAFLSNLFGTLMVADLQEVIRQFGLALASGDWSKLITNNALWVTIDTVKSRPHSVKELQGYVLSLLGEVKKMFCFVVVCLVFSLHRIFFQI